MSLQLDITLKTPEERIALVNKILANMPEPSPKYLEILSDYICYCQTKEEKQNKTILTPNRKVTIDKRETSYEGLVASLENGEDGVYNITDENTKNTIFRPKVMITKKDVETIPYLKQVREAIKLWQEKLKTAQGKEKYIIKQTIIALRKDQYIIKDSFLDPIQIQTYIKSHNYIPLEDTTTQLDSDNYPIPEGVSLLNPKVCSAILCNYLSLKQTSIGKFDEDTWYVMLDFDHLLEKALREHPVYNRIVEDKWAQMQNAEIQQDIESTFGINHSVEYISSLWRNKIPKMIASVAEDEWLECYYLNEQRGQYKKCSRCGKIKLAHNKYFSKNKTSKDGFYSICKECRNRKDIE